MNWYFFFSAVENINSLFHNAAEWKDIKILYNIFKLKNFETIDECSKRNQYIIQTLEKKPELFKITLTNLKECSKYDRCQSILCSHCKRDFRIQYVPKICEFLSRQKGESRIYAVTLLEPLDAKTTKKFNIAKLKNTLYKRL